MRHKNACKLRYIDKHSDRLVLGDISRRAAQITGINIKRVAPVVEALFKEMSAILSQGENINIVLRGLGRLHTVRWSCEGGLHKVAKARIEPVLPKTILRFKPSRSFVDRINNKNIDILT